MSTVVIQSSGAEVDSEQCWLKEQPVSVCDRSKT